MSKYVNVENRNGILILTLNRPERLNAWDTEMRDHLADILAGVNDDKDIRAVVLTGTGERAFCAGQDLNEAKTFDGPASEAWIGKFRNFYNIARRLEKPFVVALNGLAAGSAFQFALLADYRVGHDAIKMGQPEINSGIVSMTGFWLIKEVLGLTRATDLVLTGRLLPADECYNIGIVNRLVPRADVLSTAIQVAENLAAKVSAVYRANKQRICAVTQAGFEDAYEAARIQHKLAFERGYSQERMSKFLEK